MGRRRTKYNTTSIKRNVSKGGSDPQQKRVGVGRFIGNVIAGARNTVESYNVFNSQERAMRDRSLQDLYLEGVIKGGKFDDAWEETTRRLEDEPGKVVGEVITEAGIQIGTLGAGLAIKGTVTGIKAGMIGAKVYGGGLGKGYSVIRNKQVVKKFIKKGRVYEIYGDGTMKIRRAGISDITENRLQRLTRRFAKNRKEDVIRVSGGSAKNIPGDDAAAALKLIDETKVWPAQPIKGTLERMTIEPIEFNVATTSVIANKPGTMFSNVGSAYANISRKETLELISKSEKSVRINPKFTKPDEYVTPTKSNLDITSEYEGIISQQSQLGGNVATLNKGDLHIFKTQVTDIPLDTDTITRSITNIINQGAAVGADILTIKRNVYKGLRYFENVADDTLAAKKASVLKQLKIKTTPSKTLKIVGVTEQLGTSVNREVFPNFLRVETKYVKAPKWLKNPKTGDLLLNEQRDRFDITGQIFGTVGGRTPFYVNTAKKLTKELNYKTTTLERKKEIKLILSDMDFKSKSASLKEVQKKAGTWGNWSNVDKRGVPVGPTSGPPQPTWNIATNVKPKVELPSDAAGWYTSFIEGRMYKENVLPRLKLDKLKPLPEDVKSFVKEKGLTVQQYKDLVYNTNLKSQNLKQALDFVSAKGVKSTNVDNQRMWKVTTQSKRDIAEQSGILTPKGTFPTVVDDMYYIGSPVPGKQTYPRTTIKWSPHVPLSTQIRKTVKGNLAKEKSGYSKNYGKDVRNTRQRKVHKVTEDSSLKEIADLYKGAKLYKGVKLKWGGRF